MTSSPAVLLFDGDCAFCRGWVERLRRWDAHGRLEFVAARERGTRVGLPMLSDEALSRAMHLVTPDGRVYAGGRALAPLLRQLPNTMALRLLLRLPGAQPIVDRAYDAVARRRHRLGCESGECRGR